MRAFVEFADCLNFTHAAERLHLSQPALHAKIRDLSDHLQCPLYCKQGRRLLLTPQGEELAVFSRDMCRRVERFEARLRGRSDEDPLHLVADQGTLLYLLAPTIEKALGEWPGSVRLSVADGATALEMVATGKADLGVAVVEEFAGTLQYFPWVSSQSLVALPAGHPLGRKRRLRLQDLQDQRWILPPAGRPQRLRLVQAFSQAELRYGIVVETTGWELTLECVRLGLGLAIVNSICRIPKGVLARPLVGLPESRYYGFTRRGFDHPRLGWWRAQLK